MLKSAQHLNELELNKLLKYLSSKQLWPYYLLVRFGVATALRHRDLSRLKWIDILGVQRLVITENKTKKTREIPINIDLQSIIKSTYSRLHSPRELDSVFPLKLRTINKQLKVHAAKAGIHGKRISTHSFRKTFGREVWKKNGNSELSLIKLSLLFNHSSTSITRIYLDITRDEIKNLYEIDELFTY